MVIYRKYGVFFRFFLIESVSLLDKLPLYAIRLTTVNEMN